VNDARTGTPAAREAREKFDEVIGRVLTGGSVDLHALIVRQAAALRPTYSAYFGERLGTQIRFDNDASDDRTLIEIETEDRLGLLYIISQTFAELRLDISAARIVTERGAAIDSFYLSDVLGKKITVPEQLEQIAHRLHTAIGGLETVV